MQRNKILSCAMLLSVALINQSCKTQADIQRDRTVENLNQQVVNSQKTNANATLRMLAIEEQVQKLTGMIEDAQYKNNEGNKENIALKEKVATLEENNRKQNEAIKLLAEKVSEQTKYLEEVVKSLTVISEQKSRDKDNDKKENDLIVGVDDKVEISLQAGIGKYKEKMYDAAKNIFISLLENKKTKRKDKEGALQYLGLIEFKTNNFEEAKVYFSRLFSEYPDSRYNATGLLYLAKTFNKLKQNDEAIMTLEELTTRFPETKEAKEGQKLKTKL